MTRNSLLLSLVILFIMGLTHSSAQDGKKLFTEAKTFLTQGKKIKAIKKFEESLTKAQSEKNVSLQMQCHIQLADLKNTLVKHKESLEHFREFSLLYKRQSLNNTQVLRNSVSSLENEVEDRTKVIIDKNQELKKGEKEIVSRDLMIDSLTNAQLKSELAILNLQLDNQRKELDIQYSKSRQNIWFLISLICTLLVVFVLVGYILKKKANKNLNNKNRRIIQEKQRSEELLLNILPKSIAEELMINGKTKSAYFENTTVMFTDFKGFTNLAERLTPEKLVEFIDYYFVEFDRIMGKYNIEKIKTIGDAYMCVSGIPEFNEKHAQNMLNAALEIQEFVRRTKVERQLKGVDFLDLRIGIHSGPLVAGVVGEQKFAYDVWGDTVNIAARMEQSGVPSVINVSETVYANLKDEFNFNYRGEILVKNKGEMKMYLLKGQADYDSSLSKLAVVSSRKSA